MNTSELRAHLHVTLRVPASDALNAVVAARVATLRESAGRWGVWVNFDEWPEVAAERDAGFTPAETRLDKASRGLPPIPGVHCFTRHDDHDGLYFEYSKDFKK